MGTYTPDAPSLSASPAVRPYEIDDIDILDGGALLQEEEPRGEDVVPARLNAQQGEGRVANWGTALLDVEAPVTTPQCPTPLPEPEEPRAVRGKKHRKGKDAGGVLDELRRNGLLGAQPQGEIAEAPGTSPDGTFAGGAEGAWPKAEGSEGARSPILASLCVILRCSLTHV